MVTCKICKTKVDENLAICNICDYPLQGTEKEKATYVANQIIQKSQVEESIKNLKKSRIILFLMGVYFFLLPFVMQLLYKAYKTDIMNISIHMFLGIMFIGFGFLTYKKPKIALLIPLSITTIYYLVLLFINPFYIWQGVLWKIIIVMGLGYGYFSVRKSDRILKENAYLASILGFGKISNL